jgi:hypothetical protein
MTQWLGTQIIQYLIVIMYMTRHGGHDTYMIYMNEFVVYSCIKIFRSGKQSFEKVLPLEAQNYFGKSCDEVEQKFAKF